MSPSALAVFGDYGEEDVDEVVGGERSGHTCPSGHSDGGRGDYSAGFRGTVAGDKVGTGCVAYGAATLTGQISLEVDPGVLDELAGHLNQEPVFERFEGDRVERRIRLANRCSFADDDRGRMRCRLWNYQVLT